MELNYVAQMLGVIVQSYAGILAIGSTCFIFLIQQYASRLKYLDGEIMNYMVIYAPQLGPTPLMKFENEVLKGDTLFQEWLKPFKINTEISEFQYIKKLVDERKSLEKRRYIIPHSLFGSFILCCVAVFGYSLFLLWKISMGYSVLEYELILAFISSLIGIVPVILIAWKVGSLFKKD